MSNPSTNEGVCEPGSPALNTDKHLWPQVADEPFTPSIHATAGGGIGMNVGGHVIVMPIREWHALAVARRALEPSAVATEAIAAKVARLIKTTSGEPRLSLDETEWPIVLAALRRFSGEPPEKPRDLQSLCDRLAEVFNLDDTPEELSTEAREAIEELWESRDNWMKWALHVQECTDCHVGDICKAGTPLAAAVDKPAFPETKESKHEG